MNYNSIAPYYDIIMSDISYEEWINYIIDIGKIYGVKFSPAVDLACGTGNSTLPFFRKGFSVVGIDRSLQMLKVAQKKEKTINLIQADARYLPLKRTYNFVYSIFDSLNYFMQENELKLVFKNVADIIKPGGYFIFDMNTVEGIKVIAREKQLTSEDENVYSIWRHKFKDNSITLYLTLFVKEGNLYKRIDEVHRERGYEFNEVKELLTSSGLELIDGFECFSMRRPTGRTHRVMYVTKVS